jgi:hypothetical protein
MTSRGALFSILTLLVTVGSPLAATADGRFKPSEAEHTAMLRKLDQVFGWAGVRRMSDLQHVSCSDSNNYTVCNAKVSLLVDGTARSYNVEFAGSRRKLQFAAFYPDEPTPPDVRARGFYTPDQNAIRDPKLRAFAIAAVAKFNRRLRWHWFSGPSIHREGRNLLVTYHVFSDAESKRVAYVQPTLVTFYVSPRGTVCGALYSE